MANIKKDFVMEVTSIRLDRELKKIFKQKSVGTNKGYQQLIREVLWEWVERNDNVYRPEYRKSNIVGYFDGYSSVEQNCALTNMVISAGEPCRFALMNDGKLVPTKL